MLGKVSLAVGLLAVQALAAPAPNPIPYAGIEKRQVTALPAALLPDLKYYAQFSAAAYCDPNHVPGTETQCPSTICPLVTSNTVITHSEFADGGISDTTGFVARDVTRQKLVVAWRGSSSVRNWVSNALFGLTNVPFCSGCKSHSGFYLSFQAELNAINTALNALRAQYPSYGIVFTGHSLGGALASIAAAYYRSYNIPVDLYSYGAPRIGNQALSTFIGSSTLGKTYRVTNRADPVTRIPPKIAGYGIIAPEYHIKNARTPSSATTASDIEVIANPSGEVNLFNLKFDDHGQYLTPASGIGACAGSEFEWRK